MIVGLGMDLVEVARIARLLGSPLGERFLARVYTPGERAFCDPWRDRATRYAARFAAKEAASKALGAPRGIAFLDVEVERGEGPPRLLFSGVAARAAGRLGAARAHLTLTHDGGFAAATVVLESPERAP
ncbi:MAG TPA: holo-ACP synthase [Anaeromyxobacteraceae bacterium]|nr:holo-ACP synthase [Anaeromyxobacteraceae bacterium]